VSIGLGNIDQEFPVMAIYLTDQLLILELKTWNSRLLAIPFAHKYHGFAVMTAWTGSAKARRIHVSKYVTMDSSYKKTWTDYRWTNLLLQNGKKSNSALSSHHHGRSLVSKVPRGAQTTMLSLNDSTRPPLRS
jgi:hypothetical protein